MPSRKPSTTLAVGPSRPFSNLDPEGKPADFLLEPFGAPAGALCLHQRGDRQAERGYNQHKRQKHDKPHQSTFVAWESRIAAPRP
jgi:hypothetical protein